MRTLQLTLTLAASLAAAAPARGQILINPVQDYINNTTLLNDILSNARATEMSQRAQTGRAAAPGRAGPAASPTAFRHAGRSILPAMLAERAGGDAAQRQSAERYFESLLDLYRSTARKDGFPPDELAYAMEYFVVNSYMTAHDLHDVPYEKDPRAKRGRDSFDRIAIMGEKKSLTPSMLAERAVYAQMQQTLSANPSIQRMSDQEKQQMAELLAITFGTTYSAYMKGVNAEDDRLIAQARQSARQQLEKLTGAPIEQLKIDESGLRR